MSLTVEERYGMVLVRDTTLDGFERRWWFEETESSRLVLREEVAHDTSAETRTAREKWEAEVPERVSNALDDEGYTNIFDYRGQSL